MMHPTLEETLTRRIAEQGKITFAEFMDLALYWPTGGYYTRMGTSGADTDYFTAPSAHPAFGALLAVQIEQMWVQLGRPDPFVVVEQGAGSGQLARDITTYASHLDTSFRHALRYVTTDGSVRPDSRGKDPPIQGILATGVPLKHITGCFLSNELLDAIPVHRVVFRDGQTREIYVTQRDGQFLEVEDEPSTPRIAYRLEEVQASLTEGQRAEVCLELDTWIEEVATALERGFVLTIDYGHTAQELYARQRLQGTLRCYFKHTLAGNPYVRVGYQDMTAHVDFTTIADLGARQGLCGYPLQTQASFLTNLGLRTFQQRLVSAELNQRERDANRMALLELARPGGMGDFKVLVQSKNVGDPGITGVHGASDQWRERLAGLPLPLLDADHLSLMEARYPHTAQSLGQSWPVG